MISYQFVLPSVKFQVHWNEGRPLNGASNVIFSHRYCVHKWASSLDFIFFTGIVFKFRIRAPATLAKKINLHLERPSIINPPLPVRGISSTAPRANCLRFPANDYHAHVYKAVLCTRLGSRGRVCDRKWDRVGYALLMSPNKDETAVHCCHCLGVMIEPMRKVLAIPRSW